MRCKITKKKATSDEFLHLSVISIHWNQSSLDFFFYWRSNYYFFKSCSDIYCQSRFKLICGFQKTHRLVFFVFLFLHNLLQKASLWSRTSFWTELKHIIRNHLGSAVAAFHKQSKARPEPIWGLTKQQRVNQDEIYGCVWLWCERMSVLEFTVRLPGNPPPHWMLYFNPSDGCEWNLQFVNSAANTAAFQVTSVQFCFHPPFLLLPILMPLLNFGKVVSTTSTGFSLIAVATQSHFCCSTFSFCNLLVLSTDK